MYLPNLSKKRSPQSTFSIPNEAEVLESPHKYIRQHSPNLVDEESDSLGPLEFEFKQQVLHEEESSDRVGPLDGAHLLLTPRSGCAPLDSAATCPQKLASPSHSRPSLLPLPPLTLRTSYSSPSMISPFASPRSVFTASRASAGSAASSPRPVAVTQTTSSGKRRHSAGDDNVRRFQLWDYLRSYKRKETSSSSTSRSSNKVCASGEEKVPSCRGRGSSSNRDLHSRPDFEAGNAVANNRVPPSSGSQKESSPDEGINM